MSEKPWLKFYDPNVPQHVEVPRTDLYSQLRPQAVEKANEVALRFLGTSVTYAQLHEGIDTLAAALYARGVRQGDKVAILMANSPQFIMSYFALLKLGAVAVLSNPLNVARELLFKFKDSGAKGVIALDLMSQKLNKIRDEVDLDFTIYTSLKEYMPFHLKLLFPLKMKMDKRVPPVEIEWDDKTVPFQKLLQEKNPAPSDPEIDPDSLAVLIYSGGTTGVSKGIMLSHFGLVANYMQAVSWVDVREGDSILAVLPLFHGFGMSICMNAPLAMGGKVILLPRFDGNQVLQTIHKEKPTLFAGVPTMFVAFKEVPQIKEYDLTSLRGIFVGAAPLPLPVMKEFEELTGAALIEGYGLTEAVTALACNPLHGKRKPGTVGIPWPDVEWKIMDLEEGTREMPIGEPGEICIRCPELMLGYLNQPEATARALRDGWLYTGDIGIMDEDGYVTIVDRLKDLVIVSGFNVFPSEIDEVLHQHPKVSEGVAVGLPHPRKGEYIKVYVVPRPGQTLTPEEIIQFCRENVAPYKVPKEVEVREELPKSAVGKILRRELKEEEEAKAKAP